VPPALGWTVLALVFLDEVLLVVAAVVWGAHRGGPWLAVLAGAAVVAVWWTFASPKAPRGGPVVRPVTKVVVFGLGCLGLWDAGHPRAAMALLAFSVVVNAVALVPSVRTLPEGIERRS
jgi:Protein of unknown function (DUF2568)